MNFNRRLNILIIAEDYPPNFGGIAEYSHGLALALHKMDHRVTVVAPHLSGDILFDKECPYEIKRIGEIDIRRKQLGLFKRFIANRTFRQELNGWVDRMHRQSNFDLAIVSSLSEWAKICVGLFPYVVCIHGGDVFAKRADWIRTIYRKYIVKYLFENAEHIFSNSYYTLRKAEGMFGVGERGTVTYCGVSEEFKIYAIRNFKEKSTSASKKVNLLMMSRLDHIKACDTVIKAVAMLHEKYPDLVLKIAGDGPEKKKLMHLVDTLSLSKNVKFVGYVSCLETKASLLTEADIFIQSGRIDQSDREEAFGIVFAEAGLCRTPVIAPRFGGVGDVVKDGITGFLVTPDNEKEVFEKMLLLINDK